MPRLGDLFTPHNDDDGPRSGQIGPVTATDPRHRKEKYCDSGYIDSPGASVMYTWLPIHSVSSTCEVTISDTLCIVETAFGTHLQCSDTAPPTGSFISISQYSSVSGSS